MVVVGCCCCCLFVLCCVWLGDGVVGVVFGRWFCVFVLGLGGFLLCGLVFMVV